MATPGSATGLPGPHPRVGRSRAWTIPLAVGLAGMFLAHGPMIASGLRRVQTDLVDTRLNNYFLEHGYRWLRGMPGHERFWDPPFFYPAKNVGAYSDILLPIAPPYWALRAVGVAPDTSFQLWMLGLTAANYAACLALLRRGFGLSVAGATAGAFLFAFCAIRTDEITHQQLMPHFFSLLTVYALVRWGRDGGGARWVAAGATGFVLQLYAGFYLGWFLWLGLATAAVLTPLDPAWRRGAWRGLRRDGKALAVASVLSGLALWPMMSHYLAAAREVGARGTVEVALSIADLRSWIYLGPHSLPFGWLPELDFFHGIPVEQSHRKGLGIVTPALVLAGLALGWRRPEVRLLGALGLAFWVAATAIPRDLVLHLGVGLLGACLGELRATASTARRLALAAASVGLAAMLFAPAVVASGLTFAALPAAAIGLLLARPRTAFYALPALAFWATLATYPDPWAIVLLALGPVAGRIVRRRGGDGLPYWPLLGWSIAVVLALVIFRGKILVWNGIYAYVPGGNVIRVVTRAAIFLLIPAAVGIGLAVDALARRGPGSRRLALALMLACAAEQAMWTRSYDKQASRDAIRHVAGQVDPRWETFYFSPKTDDPKLDPHIPQIDAMWAAIDAGVPTINGYSGNMPPGWPPLEYAVLVPGATPGILRPALDRWVRARGLDPARVGWIGPGAPTTLAPPGEGGQGD